MVKEHGARVRFYAGVPLTSRAGYKIGVLAATDENPREGLRAEELCYTQDMARCTMEHLEWARDRVDRFRGERLVRAMATFTQKVSMPQTDTSGPVLNSGPTAASDQATSAGSLNLLRESASVGESLTRSDAGLGDDSPIRKTPEASEQDDIFTSASETLRSASLGDGCIIFGATADSASLYSSGPKGERTFNASKESTEGCDDPPMGRSCKVLSLSLSDTTRQTSSERVSGSTFSLGTLYEYSERFPHGTTFSFAKEDVVVSGSGGRAGKEGDINNGAIHPECANFGFCATLG